jgi:hypothetical protein
LGHDSQTLRGASEYHLVLDAVKKLRNSPTGVSVPSWYPNAGYQLRALVVLLQSASDTFETGEEYVLLSAAGQTK